MAVWVVRGGEREDEEEALETGVLALGYGLREDLSNVMSWQDVQKLLRDKERGAKDASTGARARSIWRFKEKIEVGDLVVMPRRSQKTVAIAEMVGEYFFRPRATHLFHGRQVAWINKDMSRDAMSLDSQKSMNASGAVYSPRSEGAELRLRTFAATGRDPNLGHADDGDMVWDEGTRTVVDDTLMEDDAAPRPREPWSSDNLAILANELLWEQEQLQEIIDDLQEKRQVIFYGPPGTGKTYVAKAIAQQCQLNGGDFEIVQFHPSYSYEDFVEGFRPRLHGDRAGFDLVSGPLVRVAYKAKERPESTFVLVIDELNRGNVAKVFGELYFLLEYRNEAVQLQYGADREGFSLPSNLWFICTMNTADRSIALMDAALRRRFYFAPFFPDELPIKGLLRRWLVREGQDTWAADLVDSANDRLDRDMGIGPSYFMGGGTLDRRRVRRIWRRSVLPYIEEQFFGDSAKLAEFNLDRLARQLDGQTETDTGFHRGQPDESNVRGQDGDGDADPS